MNIRSFVEWNIQHEKKNLSIYLLSFIDTFYTSYQFEAKSILPS